MSNLFDRAGMSSATTGTGTVTLGSALGTVAPNACSFLSFSSAGVGDQNIVSYLILDSNGAWEAGWGVYSASGTALTRNVTKSSNANAAINLSGNEQIFITARAEDIATVEALAAANIAINGAMDASQENGTTAVTLTTAIPKYTVDQWLGFFNSGTLAFQAAQVSPGTMPVVGLQNAFKLTATAGGTLGSVSTDAAAVYTPIEGYRVARLGFGASGASAITIGFWVQASVAGTFCVSVRNGSSNRSYPANVSVNNANTWEWKTVTIPGDSTGSWSTFSNAVGMFVTFCFGSGSGNQGTAGAWSAGNFFATSSTSNFFASNGNAVLITGVVILPGAHQISQEQSPLFIRPLDAELLLCRRSRSKSRLRFRSGPSRSAGRRSRSRPSSGRRSARSR